MIASRSQTLTQQWYSVGGVGRGARSFAKTCLLKVERQQIVIESRLSMETYGNMKTDTQTIGRQMTRGSCGTVRWHVHIHQGNSSPWWQWAMYVTSSCWYRLHDEILHSSGNLMHVNVDKMSMHLNVEHEQQNHWTNQGFTILTNLLQSGQNPYTPMNILMFPQLRGTPKKCIQEMHLLHQFDLFVNSTEPSWMSRFGLSHQWLSEMQNCLFRKKQHKELWQEVLVDHLLLLPCTRQDTLHWMHPTEYPPDEFQRQ